MARAARRAGRAAGSGCPRARRRGASTIGAIACRRRPAGRALSSFLPPSPARMIGRSSCPRAVAPEIGGLPPRSPSWRRTRIGTRWRPLSRSCYMPLTGSMTSASSLYHRETERRRGMARVSARHRLDIRRARSGDRLTCGVSRCPAPDEATLLPGTHPLRASAPPREPRPGCLSLDVDEPREDAKRKGSRGGAEARRGCSGGSGLPGQDRREAGSALARERRRGFA
ncbi:hypothetical protein BW41_01964 [Sphingomonas sp. RIT328]|nr:hypothetical protein BW41_01964 [Sphingomonas sp. RIT328]